ncbi:hypothetical protein FOA52_005631 [Chlamydomonas sp. UWO 241]|nr:hypothetical protein FOA52_005631 [Chlamydomonas sp. UWO 241]
MGRPQVALPQRRLATPLYAIKTVRDEQLMSEIENRKTAIIIYFYADTDDTCKLVADEIDTVNDVLGDEVTILKVDREHPDNAQLTSDMEIGAGPTVVLIPSMEGVEGVRVEGLVNAQYLMEQLSEMACTPQEGAVEPQDAPQ